MAEEKPAATSTDRIVRVTLDDSAVARKSPEVAHERGIAIHDLLEENFFRPVDCGAGPYALHLGMEDNRLILDVADEAGAPLTRVPLPLLPFRKIVKDYFLICESYYSAIKAAQPSRIEAIDMGRRGLHDEGSAMLTERLADRIAIDHATARRLFTLLCVLQIRG
jgi:uncharacterized protein (UPF0262 family)